MANYFKISNLPVVEEVPEGATVLAYADGELMRVSGDKLGSGNTVVFTGDPMNNTFSCDLPFAECYAMLEAGQAIQSYLYFTMDGVHQGINGFTYVSESADAIIFMFMFMEGPSSDPMFVQLVYASDGTVTMQQ